ncbi:MAG TPA: DUF1631 family protein [Lamprocystis sp. (in: g-proteobacteria)]|nr:DUF1631 family protein [Lamprocystis sp. (in: g-proteobacteria)]
MPERHASPAPRDEMFGRLVRAIEASPRSRRVARAGPAGSAGDPAPSLGLNQLIEALTCLQRGRVDAGLGLGLGPVRIDPAGRNVLQQLSAATIANGSHPVDALTIDIVTMLFDVIFNDPDLPATLRVEVARLQIPVLKVAMLDKAFFAHSGHPARRLLDLIASAGVGCQASDEARVVAEIQAVVDGVVAEFETDIDIVFRHVERLDDFLREEDARAQARASAVVDKLARRDREDHAQTRVEAALRERLSRRGVPAPVADFLDCHWRSVLRRAYVRAGDTGTAWVESLSTLDDLLWSVLPKHGAQERNRLLTLIPDLLRRLRTGLETAGLDGVWDPFFAQLVGLHVGALHKEAAPDAEPKQTAPEPTGTSRRIPDEHRGLKTLALVNTPSRIEYHSAHSVAAPGCLAASNDRYLWLVQSLGVGAWVEFESFRGTRKTLRLNWVSQSRGVLLFTNRQGDNAMTMATDSLAEHLRQGKARVLSQTPLTNRAVTHLLQRADHHAAN